MSAVGSTWGTRAQVGALIAELDDLQGNRDGLWNNETKPTGARGDVFERNPLASKIANAVSVGLSTSDEVARLEEFVRASEARWGTPITQLDPAQLKAGSFFAAQKAIALQRLGRTPAEVTESIVRASGSVEGHAIADRDLFVQRFRPVGESSGKVIVVAPGFQETGRNFYEQIDALNRLGHDVLVMDQQWAGYSQGRSGAVDRGFGVTRDVAAVAAHAQAIMVRDHASHPKREVILFGNSMGAGPGVLGALTMNDSGRIELDGPPMPRGLRAVLQAPYLRATPGLLNSALSLAGKLPLLNRLAVPAAGIPPLVSDPVGAQKTAQGAVMEDVRAELAAINAAQADIDRILERIDQGYGPQGEIAIVHGDRDPLADPAASVELAKKLGSRATLDMLSSENHVLEQVPGEQDRAVAALQALVAR